MRRFLLQRLILDVEETTSEETRNMLHDWLVCKSELRPVIPARAEESEEEIDDQSVYTTPKIEEGAKSYKGLQAQAALDKVLPNFSRDPPDLPFSLADLPRVVERFAVLTDFLLNVPVADCSCSVVGLLFDMVPLLLLIEEMGSELTTLHPCVVAESELLSMDLPPVTAVTGCLVEKFHDVDPKSAYSSLVSAVSAPSLSISTKLSLMGVAGLIFAAMDSQRARYVTAFVACVLSNCVDEFVKKDEFSKGPKLPLVQRWANEVVLGVQAYFESLGVVAAERQQDDFHGVAVNTNLCLLCRCMTTLMPMFRPNDDNHPVDEWNLGDLSTYHIKSLAKLVIQLHPRIFDAISRSQFLQSDAEPMGQLETAPRDFGLLSFLLLDEWPVVYAPTFKLAHCLRNSVLLVGWADSVKNDDRFTILRIALELFVHATIWMPVCSQEPYNERFSTSYGSAVAPDLVVSSIFKILASTPLSDPWKRHAHSGLQAFLGLFPLHVATAAVALVVEDTASEVVRASAATLFRRELALRPESIRPEVVNTAHRVLACLLAEQGTVVDMATVYSEGTLLFYAMNTRPDLFSKPDASLLRTLSKKIDIELKSENEVFMQGRPALALVGHNLSRALGS